MNLLFFISLILSFRLEAAQPECGSQFKAQGDWKARTTGWQHPTPFEGGPIIEAPTAVIPAKKSTKPTQDEVDKAYGDFWGAGLRNFFDQLAPERRMRSYKNLEDSISIENRKGVLSAEVFPVEILARETDSPFKEGFKIKDLAFYRTLSVVTRETSFGFYSRTYEHSFGRGIPKGLSEAVQKEKTQKNKYLSAEAKVVENGRQRQLQILKKLLIFTFPHYGRRDWHIDPKTGEAIPLDEKSLDKMISDVFENYDSYLQKEAKGEKLPLLVGWTVKALQSFPQTTYHEIFRKLPDGREETVAMVGVTRASYGVVRFFNRTTHQWEEHYGPFGSKFGEDYFTKPWDNFAPPFNVRGEDQTGPLFAKDLKPLTDVFVHTPLWSGRGVPLLPMEVLLKDYNLILPRPSVHDALYNGVTVVPKGSSKFFTLGPLPPGIDPDFSQPVILYTGQILEPTKFAINKDFEGRDDSYSQLHLLLMQTLFTRTSFSDFDRSEFNLNGQTLYTYNPGEVDKETGKIKGEVSLYLRMGWKPVPGKPPMIVNGVSWIAIQIDPQGLLNFGPNKVSNAEAKAALLQMQQDMIRFHW